MVDNITSFFNVLPCPVFIPKYRLYDVKIYLKHTAQQHLSRVFSSTVNSVFCVALYITDETVCALQGHIKASQTQLYNDLFTRSGNVVIFIE